MEITQESVFNFAEFFWNETYEASKLILIHTLIFLTVQFLVEKAQLQLPSRKTNSIKNRSFNTVYSTTIVALMMNEFFLKEPKIHDPFTPHLLILVRFINAYHYFHTAEMAFLGLITRSVIYHHIGALLCGYGAVYMDRPYLVLVIYLLAESCHPFYQTRAIMNILNRHGTLAYDLLTIFYTMFYLVCRCIIWPIVVYKAGQAGYPVIFLILCLSFWIQYLFLVNKE